MKMDHRPSKPKACLKEDQRIKWNSALTALRSGSAIFLIGACLFVASCSGVKEAGKTLGALVEVRHEIVKKFGENTVDVNLNSYDSFQVISIVFTNSPLNEKTSDDRSKRGQQVAEIVKTHYADIKSVDQISVAFIRSKSYFLFFHSRAVLDHFAFDREGKPLAGSPEGSTGAASTPNIRYAAAENQTYVSVDDIQLEGVAGDGLTMLPRMVVKGDTSKETPKPPQTVQIDFASFAAQQQFPGVTKIRFTGDKETYDTEGQFSTSRGNDGLINEFLYLKMPYNKFLKLTNTNSFKVQLNDRQFQLTDQQLKSLRAMTTYVKN